MLILDSNDSILAGGNYKRPRKNNISKKKKKHSAKYKSDKNRDDDN
jgi:hypothetical protein